MNKKLLILGSAILCASQLNGCATAVVVDEITKRGQKNKTLVEDQFSAYDIVKESHPSNGKPLLLIGAKNNYLIETEVRNGSTQQHLIEIITQLDPTYLSVPIIPNSGTFIRSKPEVFTTTVASSKATYTDKMRILYSKPLQLVTKQERNHLGSLNFYCAENAIPNKYFCNQDLPYQMSLIKKAKNEQLPQYLLSKPMQLEVKLQRKKSVLTKAYYFPLLPVTAAVDIVTAPIQMFFWFEAFKAGIGSSGTNGYGTR